MLCTELTLIRRERKGIYAEPLKCRRWSCPVCRPIRKRQLQRQAAQGEPDTFITLTVNPARGTSPSERARELVKAWREVRARACKRYGYDRIPFIAIFESTRRAEPHLHILARCKWIDQRWLSEQMEALIGAPIVDIRRVKSRRQAARYVSKYVGKEPRAFDGTKRYFRSLDYLDPARESGEIDDGKSEGWEVVRVGYFDYLASMNSQGHVVVKGKDHALILPPPARAGPEPPPEVIRGGVATLWLRRSRGAGVECRP